MLHTIRVHGTSYRQAAVGKLPRKLRFRLVAEPENEYDEEAVAVYSEDAQALLVGYLPMGWMKEVYAAKVKELLGRGGAVPGTVIGGHGTATMRGVALYL